MHAFFEKSHYFRNDDPYRHKTLHLLVDMRVRAKFRHRLGGVRPQTT